MDPKLQQRLDAPTPGDDVYERIVAILDHIPWDDEPRVERINPANRENIDFFPGHRGFIGSVFPVGGIMMVGNNFCSRSGKLGLPSWVDSVDEPSRTMTWQKLRKWIIPASGVSMEHFWFTNYCHGAMDVLDSKGYISESYDFPADVVEKLKFRKAFERSVELMRPRLIVSLGNPARDWLIRHGHSRLGYPMIAIAHPSARFSQERFRSDGARIGHAYLAAKDAP